MRNSMRIGPNASRPSNWFCDKLVSALRAKLSADDLAELSAEGAAWSEDQAMQEALSEAQE